MIILKLHTVHLENEKVVFSNAFHSTKYNNLFIFPDKNQYDRLIYLLLRKNAH